MTIGVIILMIVLALTLSVVFDRSGRASNPELEAEELAETERRITEIEREAEAQAEKSRREG